MLKFNCQKDDLLNAVIPAMYGVATRASNPILEGLQIKTSGDTVYVTGYDCEKGVKAHFTATKVWEQGSAIFEANQLYSIVKGLPDGDISISIDTHYVASVQSYKTVLDIHTKSDDNYPALPYFEGDKKITVNQGIFKKMISQVIFAIGDNDQKPVLKGVFFNCSDNKIEIAALDGFRLALRKYTFDGEGHVPFPELKFIVPGKSLTDLLKLMDDDSKDVDLELTDSHLIVNFENASFVTRLIDGEFMDFTRFIPKNNKTFITVETSKVINCAERAALITNEKNKTPVKFNFRSDMISISCATVTGRIYDEIEAEISGDEIELAFNNKYILDTFRVCPEKVKIELSTARSSMLITPANDEDDFIYLVLPVNMKE